ncbi:DUF92 domain-containing protein [Acidicapsa ligni]|uniref:DUF92 domain-containing protein n=1 Tax=Acidicapsa ligni TaxID=542300 RepID=UPI0021E0BAB2|nr:DUF92 domain-containing protein [Acidicapsa ligni]
MGNLESQHSLNWQSKIILLLVVPWTAISALLDSLWWSNQVPVVAWTTLGICSVFGLVVWRLRAGTAAAAATGATLAASLMYSTTNYPYSSSWLHGGLLPVLAVFLIAYAATKIGRSKKEKLGTSEEKHGRNSAQVAANLGAAALLAHPTLSALFLGTLGSAQHGPSLALTLSSAALAEAAADTASSEIGQVFGGRPRMVTSLRVVEPGTDGAITLIGTAAGVVAAAIIGAVSALVLGPVLGNGWSIFWLVFVGGVFGLLFDSLLGATLERGRWLNNDAVNFLSTLSAPAFSVAVVLALEHFQFRY